MSRSFSPLFLTLLVSTYALMMPATMSAALPPVLECIARHESGIEQFTPSGHPLVSPTGDVGIMQINMATWLPLARRMGLDIINNPIDNVEFGIWLYKTQGPYPWTTYQQYCLGAQDT
jgi:hypothetical protein